MRFPFAAQPPLLHEAKTLQQAVRGAIVGIGIGEDAALAVARRLWLPELPTLVPIAALALGVLNMIAAIGMRTVYHARRMKGD